MRGEKRTDYMQGGDVSGHFVVVYTVVAGIER